MSARGKDRTGRIAGSYKTRAGETVWIVAWDDRGRAPPFDVEVDPGLEVGGQVRLIGSRLVRQ